MNQSPGFNPRSRWKLHMVAAIAAMSSLTVSGTAPASDGGASNYNITEKVWIDGVTRDGYVRLFDDHPKGPDVDVYLVGTIDLEHPQETELEPTEPTIHDLVSSKTPYGRRGRCHSYQVLPGPNATEDTVHVRVPEANPGFEWVRPPYEIDLGEGFVPLVNTDVIEAGLDAGLLAITADLAAGLNPVCWTGCVDPSFPRFD